MKFTIDNEVPPAQSPLLARCLKALNELKDGELLTARGVSNLMTISPDYFTSISTLIPAELSVRHGAKKLYGNPKTIAAWKKQQIQH